MKYCKYQLAEVSEFEHLGVLQGTSSYDNVTTQPVTALFDSALIILRAFAPLDHEH